MNDPEHAREHLANERTYLAWLRTSFSLLTLGFATSKFGQFLLELRLKSDRELPHGYLLGSRRFGLGMVILGTILMPVATWNYCRMRKQIQNGTFQANILLIVIVGVLSIAFGVTAIVLLLLT